MSFVKSLWLDCTSTKYSPNSSRVTWQSTGCNPVNWKTTLVQVWMSGGYGWRRPAESHLEDKQWVKTRPQYKHWHRHTLSSFRIFLSRIVFHQGGNGRKACKIFGLKLYLFICCCFGNLCLYCISCIMHVFRCLVTGQWWKSNQVDICRRISGKLYFWMILFKGIIHHFFLLSLKSHILDL